MGNVVTHNIWDAIADTPEEADSLRIRANLMHSILDLIEDRGWNQTEAAERIGVKQPRISALKRGKVDQFSIDALVEYATHLGLKVSLEVA